MRIVTVLTLMLIVLGCARGFDRGALREQMAQDSPAQITSSDIQRALELKPQLKFPFRLAVYLQEERSVRTENERNVYSHQTGKVAGVSGWRWEGEDKDQILSLAEKLKTDGVISDMFIIPQARVVQSDLAGVRLAAAEHGADAVLVVNGLADVDRYNNYSAFLYLTVVGLWVVPGTHADSLFVIDGAMWDVRNQYLYLSVESEGLASRMGPQMVLKHIESVAEAKKSAVQAFVPELGKRLRVIAGLK